MLEHHRLNGGEASDWLRQSQQLELQICPKHLVNDTCLEPYGSVNRIPSTIGGNEGHS